MTPDYDFQQITGRVAQVMIYFKINSEERIGCRSYKQLSGRDLNGGYYTGLGVRDCEQVLRAINVRMISPIMTQDLSQYIEAEDGQIIIQEESIPR